MDPGRDISRAYWRQRKIVPADRITSFFAAIRIRFPDHIMCDESEKSARCQKHIPEGDCASSTPRNTGAISLVAVGKSLVTRVPIRISKLWRVRYSGARKAVAALLRAPFPIVDCNHPVPCQCIVYWCGVSEFQSNEQHSPIPRGFPEFMSRLNGNSASSVVVLSTRESRTLALPGRLVRSGPAVPWTDVSNCPCMLWPSAGGESFSLCGRWRHIVSACDVYPVHVGQPS